MKKSAIEHEVELEIIHVGNKFYVVEERTSRHWRQAEMTPKWKNFETPPDLPSDWEIFEDENNPYDTEDEAKLAVKRYYISERQ